MESVTISTFRELSGRLPSETAARHPCPRRNPPVGPVGGVDALRRPSGLGLRADVPGPRSVRRSGVASGGGLRAGRLLPRVGGAPGVGCRDRGRLPAASRTRVPGLPGRRVSPPVRGLGDRPRSAPGGSAGRRPRCRVLRVGPVPQRARLDVDLGAERRQVVLGELECPVPGGTAQRVGRAGDPLGPLGEFGELSGNPGPVGLALEALEVPVQFEPVPA